MSGANSKPADNEAPPPKPTPGQQSMEEDDEFEDFPVEDWPASETTTPSKASGADAATATAGDDKDAEANAHLWEESWDDDDASDDFAAQLREEMARVEKGGK